MTPKRKRPEVVKHDRDDIHIVTLKKSGLKRIFIVKNSKDAYALAMSANPNWQYGENMILRPFDDGEGYGILGTMRLTPTPESRANARARAAAALSTETHS